MPTTPKSDYFTSEQEQTARFAKALGHPVRIAILELLNSQSCCFHGDMAEELPIAKSTLSQHLNELKDAGLIQGNITPPTVKYCINRNNWEMARSLLNELLTPNLEQNIALVLNPEQLMEPKTKRL
jgi:DNA-binding HxlR family transcriptional regulator